MTKTKPMEIINVRTVRPTDFDPEDIDAFVHIANRTIPEVVEALPWEQEVQKRINNIRYWAKMALISVTTFVILGFSLIGMIATIAHFTVGG